jgi:hypothetical protein
MQGRSTYQKPYLAAAEEWANWLLLLALSAAAELYTASGKVEQAARLASLV